MSRAIFIYFQGYLNFGVQVGFCGVEKGYQHYLLRKNRPLISKQIYAIADWQQDHFPCRACYFFATNIMRCSGKTLPSLPQCGGDGACCLKEIWNLSALANPRQFAGALLPRRPRALGMQVPDEAVPVLSKNTSAPQDAFAAGAALSSTR